LDASNPWIDLRTSTWAGCWPGPSRTALPKKAGHAGTVSY